jgi:AmmeMemoRadiSam system protein A
MVLRDPLNDASRSDLLQRARAAIARAIGAEPPVPAVQSPLPGFTRAPELRAGAFVTLRVGGELRGCVGYPEPSLLLVDVVERCAVSAAISDPRFPAVTPLEWDSVDVEISVLGSLEPVEDIADVQIGRDGLIVEFGERRGLLLPQVATEWGWDARDFASQTCLKAGLPKDAWQKGAKLFKFEAEVFGES